MPYSTASGGDNRVPSSSLWPHHNHPETALPFPYIPHQHSHQVTY